MHTLYYVSKQVLKVKFQVLQMQDVKVEDWKSPTYTMLSVACIRPLLYYGKN